MGGPPFDYVRAHWTERELNLMVQVTNDDLKQSECNAPAPPVKDTIDARTTFKVHPYPGKTS